METSIRFQGIIDRMKQVAIDNPFLQELSAEFIPISKDEMLAVAKDFCIDIKDCGFGSWWGAWCETLNEDQPGQCELSIYIRHKDYGNYLMNQIGEITKAYKAGMELNIR